jgi:cation diffusion facilitator family transporter
MVVAWISFVGTSIVLALKVVAYVKTGSHGIFSDTIESVVDIISTVVTLFIMKAVAEPADQEHPYGHGKLEYFSAAIEGALIVLAALYVGYEAIIALISGGQVEEIGSGLWYLTITIFVNTTMAWYIYRKGKEARSEALIAKSKHALADLVTTVAVMVGLGLVRWTGYAWTDSAAGLLVALHLLREGTIIVRRAVGGLIDESDEDSLKELAAAFEKYRVPGFIDVHQMKVIRSGRFHHVDAHVVMPEFWDILKANAVVQDVEKNVVSAYPYDGEVAFHLDPCLRAHCRSCEVAPCPVRRHPFEKRWPFTPESIVKIPLPVGHDPSS